MSIFSVHAADLTLPDPGKGRLLPALLVAAFAVSACASIDPVTLRPPPLEYSGPPVRIDDPDILAVSEPMQAFVERYILPYESSATQRQLLALAVAEYGLLGFQYDEESTLTAKETFRRRSGNCISHANMVVAMARYAGLEARYQEIITQPYWTSHDDIFFVGKHINVILAGAQYGFEVDVSGTDSGMQVRRRILTDEDGKAMYLNNLGAQSLLQNDLPKAYAYMTRAIETSPGLADSWINLGVVYGRNNQQADAERVYKHALQIDPGEYSALNNLYGVYKSQGRHGEAQKLKTRVEFHRRKNPYYLLYLANEAQHRSRFSEAVSLMKKAVRKKDDDHELHFALARAQYLSGNIEAAHKSLFLARQTVPRDSPEDYSLPIEQLMGPAR